MRFQRSERGSGEPDYVSSPMGRLDNENWNKILRWLHFSAGLLISGYFFLMPGDGWSDTVNNVFKFGIVSFVFWTGVIRWNLPRIRKWSKARSETA